MQCEFERNNELLKPYRGVNLSSDLPSDELKNLANLANFPAVGYRPHGVAPTEEQHSQSDALFDFVRVFGEVLYDSHPTVLHNAVHTLLLQEGEQNPSAFLRNACLAKHLLAYQLFIDPESAAFHFTKGYYLKFVEKQGGVEEFNKRMILPIQQQFAANSFDLIVDTSAEEARILALNAQHEHSRSRESSIEDFDVDSDSKEQSRAPISFFMVMTHPAVEITSIILFQLGIAALTLAVVALAGVGAVSGATTLGLFAGGAGALGLSVFYMVTFFLALEDPLEDDIVISAPLLKQ